MKKCIYLLSLLEIFFQRIAEPLAVLDKLSLALIQGLFTGRTRYKSGNFVHRVQKFLYRARDLSERTSGNERRITARL